MFYEVVGKASIALAGGFLALLLFSTILGFLLVRKKKFILPKVLLFTVDTFYLQIKRLANNFGLGEKIIDQVGIDIRNHLFREEFAKISPQDKILVLPQCIRDLNCPARLDPASGIKCRECGKCVIKELKEEADRLGYRLYVVPGGRFVERIVKAVRPKAALGVACHKDLNLAMHEISRANIIVQGVPLMRDGCMNTAVDLKELLRLMRLDFENTLDAAKQCMEVQPKVQ